MIHIDYCVFTGTYGGSNYELHFLDELKSITPLIHETYIKRDGWLKTSRNIFKSIFRIIFSRNRLVRSFTIPVYKKNMYVIIHHFDNKYDPWYCKIIENIDFYILKMLNNCLNIRVICVSKYWQSVFLKNGFKNVLIFYNTCNIQSEEKNDSRTYISSKYSIDANKKWIYLGSSIKKKGAQNILRNIKADIDVDDYEIICTGNNQDIDCNILWFENDDYKKFLTNCYFVALNSLFKEGWCRIAHEAVLLEVPLLGNGSGGMQELLDLSDIATVKFENFIIKDHDLNRYIGKRSNLQTYINRNNNIFLKEFKKDLEKR
jgi:hypothetical protein